jgi:hypothetical protein
MFLLLLLPVLWLPSRISYQTLSCVQLVEQRKRGVLTQAQLDAVSQQVIGAGGSAAGFVGEHRQ